MNEILAGCLILMGIVLFLVFGINYKKNKKVERIVYPTLATVFVVLGIMVLLVSHMFGKQYRLWYITT